MENQIEMELCDACHVNKHHNHESVRQVLGTNHCDCECHYDEYSGLDME
jgi:hypothetical protein